MVINNKLATWLLRSVMCSVLLLGVTACSDDDDNSSMMPGDGDDGDDDAAQETVNTDGSSSFVVPLSAEQEVPPVDEETASGEGSLTIDRQSGSISGSVSVSDLTGQASAAHIHQGLGGINGGPLITLEGNADGSVWSVPADSVLDASALTFLADGALYINVHTAENAGGELRGQIIPTGIAFEDSELSGDEEVPPVVTEASGVGVSTVNLETGAISATLFIDGLDAATMAHIHTGAEGVNGDVVIGLEQDGTNPGIWRTPVPSTLSAEQITAYEDEGLYFNVHSADNSGGELRGQL